MRVKNLPDQVEEEDSRNQANDNGCVGSLTGRMFGDHLLHGIFLLIEKSKACHGTLQPGTTRPMHDYTSQDYLI